MSVPRTKRRASRPARRPVSAPTSQKPKRPAPPASSAMQARLDATIRGVYARLDAWNAGVALPEYERAPRPEPQPLGREEQAALANLEANWGLSRDLDQ